MANGGEREMDDLFARVETIDEPSHTVRRAVGLGTALVLIGAGLAIAVTSGAGAVVMAVLRAAMERWVDQF